MLSFCSIYIFYSSSHAWHITNITGFSNRTIDYLTAAKPEAYQAHSRRVSAAKMANQKQQQHQQEKQRQQHKEKDSNPSAYNLRSDLEPALPVNLREHKPKCSCCQRPYSAPAVLPSTTKKMAIAQGEIPIGIEPSLSPLANAEMDC